MEDLLTRAGLDLTWADTFVRESNLLDPQPGQNVPGHPLYDCHMQALLYALESGMQDCYALPREVHKILLGAHPLAGALRTQPFAIGFRRMMAPNRVRYRTWGWNVDARTRIGRVRTRDTTAEERQTCCWDLHCELMNIRPFELFNGRVGRVVMVNHALLVGEVPWIVRYGERDEYVELIKRHPSATWLLEDMYVPSAVRYREW